MTSLLLFLFIRRTHARTIVEMGNDSPSLWWTHTHTLSWICGGWFVCVSTSTLTPHQPTNPPRTHNTDAHVHTHNPTNPPTLQPHVHTHTLSLTQLEERELELPDTQPPPSAAATDAAAAPVQKFEHRMAFAPLCIGEEGDGV